MRVAGVLYAYELLHYLVCCQSLKLAYLGLYSL